MDEVAQGGQRGREAERQLWSLDIECLDQLVQEFDRRPEGDRGRLVIADAVRIMPGRRALEQLWSWAVWEEPAVRGRAINGLAFLSKNPMEIYVKALRESEMAEERRLAVNMLVSVGEEAVPYLLEALEFDDTEATAGWGLGEILGREYHIDPADPPEKRRKIVARIRKETGLEVGEEK